jgi:hypothetical protein
MKRRLAAAACVAACAWTAGCALRSTDVQPALADAAEFGGWTCSRIAEETDRVQRHATRVAYAFDERAGNNIIAMGLGVTVFWPALLAMRTTEPDAALLSALKGRHEALARAAADRPCAAVAEAAPAAGVAALPVGVGDTLIYEQRPVSRGPAQFFSLRVTQVGRDALQLEPARPAPGGTSVQWLHDRSGNLKSAPQAPVWPELLRADLTLGQVVAGELRDPADPGQRARVRGQVVAVGPQSIAGRRFDVAVIDLFGDAGTQEASTRLDGVLVVDRASGVLLRLDLFSGHPVFQLQRRLARVEHLP